MTLPFTAPRRPSNVTLAVMVTFFTGLYFYLPVMTTYLSLRGLSLFQISAMSSLIVATQFLAEVPTGILADRWGRKASWVIAVTLQLAGEVWFFFARAYWEFALIAVLAGLGYAFASGAIEALIYDTLPPDRREERMKQAMGQLMAAQFAGNLLAFLASGLILAQPTAPRFALAIALTAASVGVGWVVTWFVFEPRERSDRTAVAAAAAGPDEFAPAPRQHPLATVYSGLRLLRDNPALRRLALLMVLSDPFSFYLMSFFQPYFAAAGVASRWFGPVIAAGSLLAAASSRYAYRAEEKLGKRPALLLGTALPGLVYLLMATTRQPAAAVGLLLAQYGLMYAARPLLRAYINGHIAGEHRATVLSMIQLVNSVYLALIGLLLGWVGDRSLTALFALMGALILAAALVFRVREKG